MRVAVIGAGVVGIACAFNLATDGHEVTVFDSRASIGDAATAVNAGLIVPGDSTVWGTPGAPAQLLRALFGRGHSFIRVRPGAGPALIPWGLRFLRECLDGRSRRNVRAAHALSSYSYSLLEELEEDEGLQFDHQRNGMVFLYGSDESLAEGLRARSELATVGETFDTLSPAALAKLDAGFSAVSTELAGAIYTPGSGHGDSQAFARGLAALAIREGVDIRLNSSVERIVTREDAVDSLSVEGVNLEFDAVVVAAGASSSDMLHGTGVHVPILPGKGYAVTVPIIKPKLVPQIGGVDERSHVAFSRMGKLLRISSTAEFSGHNARSKPEDYASIRSTARELFPDALDWGRALYQTGLRPMTPSGIPIISETSVSGLYVNAGHGHLGWTQACGSAQLIADIIAGRSSVIDRTPYLLRAESQNPGLTPFSFAHP